MSIEEHAPPDECISSLGTRTKRNALSRRARPILRSMPGCARSQGGACPRNCACPRHDAWVGRTCACSRRCTCPQGALCVHPNAHNSTHAKFPSRPWGALWASQKAARFKHFCFVRSASCVGLVVTIRRSWEQLTFDYGEIWWIYTSQRR